MLGIVIVEDDLLFSPDFIDIFFLVTTLDMDPTLWIVNGMITGSRPGLRSVDFVVQFGRARMDAPRKEWEQRLASMWPDSHWDWFMLPRNEFERECVCPEVHIS